MDCCMLSALARWFVSPLRILFWLGGGGLRAREADNALCGLVRDNIADRALDWNSPHV